MSIYSNIVERVKFITGVGNKRKQMPYHINDTYSNVMSPNALNELEATAYGTMYSCLQIRCNGLVSSVFKGYKLKNWDKEEISNAHWVSRLLQNPNPFFTYSQLITFLEQWLCINGNAFIWTPTLGHDVPLQMWILNPTRMKVIKGGNNFIEGYVYNSIKDGQIYIHENEMIHLAKVNPAGLREEIVGMNIFGTGLVTAALQYAAIDNEVGKYLLRLLANNAVPPLVASIAEDMDADEWSNMRNQWNERLPNYKLNALLTNGMSISLPPESQISISYESISKDVRSQIAQVFGVPTGMLTGEYQNRATAEVQYAVFRQQTIYPESNYIAEELTRHFQRFEDDIIVESLPYEFIDIEKQIKQEEFEIKYGISTINDIRGKRGYDKLPNGDVVLIAQGLQPLQSILTSANTNTSTDVVKKKVIRNLVLNTPEQRAIHWRAYDDIQQDVSKQLIIPIKNAITDINVQAIDAIESDNPDDVLQVNPESLNQIQDKIDKAITNVTNKVLKEFESGNENLSGDFGKQMQSMANETNMRISDSLELIRNDIASTLSQNANKSKDELREILQNKYKQLSRGRAEAIAQTTATSVTTGVQKNVYKDFKQLSMWNTQRDKNVRPSHRAMDGQIENQLGYFTFSDGSKIDRPAGSSQAGTTVAGLNVVRCRCYLFPVDKATADKLAKQNKDSASANENNKNKIISEFENKYRNLTTHEMGLIVGKNGNKIAFSKGGADSVSFTKDERMAMLNDGGATVTHNHPKIASLSNADLGVMMLYNAQEMRAVDSKYTYIAQRTELTKLNNIKTQDDFDLLLNTWTAKMESFASRKMAVDGKLGQKLEDDYINELNEDATHKATEWFCQKNNITYKRIKHG